MNKQTPSETQLEIELEKLKIKKQKDFHKYRMDELAIRLKIAELYNSKNKKKRLKKAIKKAGEKFK